jgi:hypothetical protein
MATGQGLENTREQILAYMHLNFWGGSTLPVLATGTTTSKFKNTNTIQHFINGIPAAAITTADFSIAVPTGYAPGVAGQQFIPAGAVVPAVSGSGGVVGASWPATIVAMNSAATLASWIRYLIVADATALYALPSFVGLGSATAAPDAPPVPAGYVVIGDLTVKVTAGTVFTPGTTLLGAGGVTAVFRDLAWPDTGPSAYAARVGLTALANVI